MTNLPSPTTSIVMVSSKNGFMFYPSLVACVSDCIFCIHSSLKSNILFSHSNQCSLPLSKNVYFASNELLELANKLTLYLGFHKANLDMEVGSNSSKLSYLQTYLYIDIDREVFAYSRLFMELWFHSLLVSYLCFLFLPLRNIGPIFRFKCFDIQFMFQ